MKGTSFRYGSLLLVLFLTVAGSYAQVSIPSGRTDIVIRSGKQSYTFKPTFHHPVQCR